jgi:hypothetical protein
VREGAHRGGQTRERGHGLVGKHERGARWAGSACRPKQSEARQLRVVFLFIRRAMRVAIR